MSNRTLVFLTTIVIVGMVVLFALNMTSLLTGQPPNQNYLKFNDVRGIAISNNQMLYTLNFQQQNQVIEILNAAVAINTIEGKRNPPNIDKLVIYQFEGQPDIILTPIGYVEKNMIFGAPQWVPNGYLKEISEGALQQLLSQTYD